MMDSRTQAVLQGVLRRESLSLLQYVSEAFPWAGPEDREALAKFRRVTDEDREGIGELRRYLAREKIMPSFIGSFPQSFTSLGFVSLQALLPKLVEAQRRHIAALERDLGELTDAEAKALVQKILDRKRRHLTELESISPAHPATVR
jgi:rubrerythrin